MSSGLALSWALHDIVELLAVQGILLLFVTAMRDSGFVPYIEREQEDSDER